MAGVNWVSNRPRAMQRREGQDDFGQHVTQCNIYIQRIARRDGSRGAPMVVPSQMEVQWVSGNAAGLRGAEAAVMKMTAFYREQ